MTGHGDDLVAWLCGVLDEDLRQTESDLFADRITVERARAVKFDVEAKRQLIGTAMATREEADAALAQSGLSVPDRDAPLVLVLQAKAVALESAVAIVATAYRDRPGYREEWKP